MEKKQDRLNSLYKWLRHNPIAAINALDLIKQHSLLTTGQIAEMLDLTRPTVTKMIASLANKGWVEVQQNPNDKRIKTVALTPDGDAELLMKKTELESIIGPV